MEYDFLTNSIMMPLAALATVILILLCVKFNAIDSEVELSSKFKRKRMYHFILKYLSIAFITIILLSSIANVFGWIVICLITFHLLFLSLFKCFCIK